MKAQNRSFMSNIEDKIVNRLENMSGGRRRT